IAPPRKAQTATTRPSTSCTSSIRPATGVQRTEAIPARPTIAVIGSWRARAASSESSRSAAKTGRGSSRTRSARRSQARSCIKGGWNDSSHDQEDDQPPEQLKARVVRTAREENRSQAAVIREAVEE